MKIKIYLFILFITTASLVFGQNASKSVDSIVTQKPKVINNGYYIDTLNNKVACNIIYNWALIKDSNNRHRHYEYQVIAIDSNSNRKILNGNNIKGYSITSDPRNPVNYNSVNYQGKKVFLRESIGGEHLKRYVTGSGKYTRYYYYNNDTLVEQNRHEKYRDWEKRFFSDYPLLSQMAYNNEFDEMYGNENTIIYDEYDKWINSSDEQKKDTSLALKGIIDANKQHISKKYFWNNFLVSRFSGLLGLLLFDKKLLPNETSIIIPKTPLSTNAEYLKAYKARMRTRITKKAYTARLLGVFAPPFIIII